MERVEADDAAEPQVDSRRSLPPEAIQVIIIVVAFVAYSTLRVLIEGPRDEAVRNAERLMDLQRTLMLDWERAAQDWVLDRPNWMTFWNAVYMYLYWVVVVAILGILWFRNRQRFFLLRNTLMISAAIGLVIWATFPVAPPRFAGYVDTLALTGDRVLDEREGWVNRYAAVPSFHVGWPAICGYVLAAGTRSAWRWTLALVPTVLLAFSVVFTGNHFILDIVAGLVVVAVALQIATFIEARSTHEESGVTPSQHPA